MELHSFKIQIELLWKVLQFTTTFSTKDLTNREMFTNNSICYIFESFMLGNSKNI